MARLMVHPRETVTFEEFEQRAPGPAVALDGYVIGPTRWSPAGTHASFDHHADVDRFSTRATCEQVALALRSRFSLVTGDGGRPRDGLTVHVNDPDPDVSLSWWLLCHPALVDHPAVRTLVDLEGAVDSSGGTAAPGDPAVLEVLAWVAEPWARRRDDVANMTAEEMAEVIAECAERMDAVVAGRPGRVPLSASYETLAEEAGVWAVVEHHPLARARVVVDGAEVVVAVRPGPVAGTQAVSVAKGAPWVDVDLDLVWAELNDAEGIAPEERDRWGGSDLVGGSPRERGTRLAPGEVCRLVADCYGRRLRS